MEMLNGFKDSKLSMNLINKIKNENPAASLDELKAIAAKKGGTSVLSCIGFVLLDIFMILILLFILS